MPLPNLAEASTTEKCPQLRKFGKSFKLDLETEIMPYQLYTQDNIEKVYVPIFGAVSFF